MGEEIGEWVAIIISMINIIRRSESQWWSSTSLSYWLLSISKAQLNSSVSRCHQQRPPPSSSQTARHNLWFSKRPQFSCVCYVAAMMALPSQSLSTSSSSSRSQKRLPMWPCAMIAIKNILTDSEHSVVLKEISVPLWDHDRFFIFGNLSNNFEPLFHAGSPFSHYRCGRALRTQFGPGYR